MATTYSWSRPPAVLPAATLTLPPIDEIIQRIAEAFHPRRIVVFGSRGRGESRPDSDLDLMVEMETDARPAARARAMDVVVYTPAEVERLRNVRGTLLSVIEEEGRALYERSA